MFFACGIWCVADVSSVSPSSEQTEELWGNQCLNSFYTLNGNNETRKRKEQRLIFKLGTLAPNGINERFSCA